MMTRRSLLMVGAGIFLSATALFAAQPVEADTMNCCGIGNCLYGVLDTTCTVEGAPCPETTLDDYCCFNMPTEKCREPI